MQVAHTPFGLGYQTARLADLVTCFVPTCLLPPHRSYNPTSKALTAKWQNKDGSIVGVKFVQAWEKQEERFRPFLPDGVYYLSATAADDFQLFCKRYCRGENSATQSDCTPDICDPEEDTVPERDTGEVTLSFEANV